jgi:hypothetical protein
VTQATAEQRARYEQAGRAVHAFIATGVTPLLAAASAQASTDALSRSAAVVALRANPTTRIALDNAFASVRGVYNQARAAWAAGQYESAASGMEAVRTQCVRLYRQMVEAVPQVQEILATLAANLATAPLDGLGAGLGMAAALVGVLLLVMALK